LKKRLLSLVLMVSLLTILLAPSSTASASSVYIDQYVKVNWLSINQTQNTATLNYTLLQSVPYLSHIMFYYSYSVPQLSGSSVELTGTVGQSKSVSFTIPVYNCGVNFGLRFTAYTYSEEKFLSSYFQSSTPTVTYHTVTEGEAIGNYIIVSGAGLVINYVPQTKGIKVLAQVLIWGGAFLDLGTAANFLDVYIPTAGNYIKTTVYYSNYQMHIDTLLWNNYESYSKGVTPKSFSSTYNIPQ